MTAMASWLAACGGSGDGGGSEDAGDQDAATMQDVAAQDSATGGNDATIDSGTGAMDSSTAADTGARLDSGTADSAPSRDSGTDANVADSNAGDSNVADSNVSDSNLVDAHEDAPSTGDTGADAPSEDSSSGGDSATADASEDAPSDAAGQDAADAGPSFVRACNGATAPPVFVLDGKTGNLYTFDLTNFTFGTTITLGCTTAINNPNSIAIDGAGNSLIEYADQSVQSFNLATSVCTYDPAGVLPGAAGFYALHYVHNAGGSGETLYAANQDGTSATLYSITVPEDGGTWTSTPVGLLMPKGGTAAQAIAIPDLAGSDDGTLYALYANTTTFDLHIATVSRTDATLSNDVDINPSTGTNANALFDPNFTVTYDFIEWQGTFYIFYGDTVYSYSAGTGLAVVTSKPGATFYGASKTDCSP
jgi:hypothetical protein